MTPSPLTSTRNPRVRAAAALRQSRQRRATGLHLAEGPNAVLAALVAGHVSAIYATPAGWQLLEGHAGDDVAARNEVECITVSDAVIGAIADAASPQPVVAVVRTPQAQSTDLEDLRALIVLDNVSDPGNVGTLIRSADAFGFHGVVALDGADPYGPKAVRSSAGSLYAIPVVSAEGAGLTVDVLANGRVLVGLVTTAPHVPVDQALAAVDQGQRVAMVIGSESRGLRAEVEQRVDIRATIPMRTSVDSLNAGVAGSIAMYAAAAAMRH